MSAFVSTGRLTSVRPLWAIEGGRVTLEGTGFPVDPELPRVRVGAKPARLARASPSALSVVVPAGLDGGAAIASFRLDGETVLMADKLKVGLVGCGGIAKGKHLPSLSRLNNVETRRVLRHRAGARGRSAPPKYGTKDAKTYTDYENCSPTSPSTSYMC